MQTNLSDELRAIRVQAEIDAAWLEHDGEDEVRQRRLRKLIRTIQQTEEQALSAELNCFLAVVWRQDGAQEERMPLHYPGLSEALRQMESADLPRLYEQLDALFGRDNLPDDPTIEDVRAEAIRQTQIEFTDEMSPE